MPLLDVSEILTDPDFCQPLICNRLKQTVGEDGLAINTPVRIRFTGVVTTVSGLELERNAVGELITGTILICTRFRLTDGKSGLSADIIDIGPRRYTVTNVYLYSQYGRGFVEAVCDLIPLAGTIPGAYDPPECP
jgi:galactose-6-phosphate isomerase